MFSPTFQKKYPYVFLIEPLLYKNLHCHELTSIKASECLRQNTVELYYKTQAEMMNIRITLYTNTNDLIEDVVRKKLFNYFTSMFAREVLFFC